MILMSFMGLMYRLYGLGQLSIIKFDMIVYFILIAITVFIFLSINLALDNIKHDQLISAVNNLQEIKIVEKVYQSIQ